MITDGERRRQQNSADGGGMRGSPKERAAHDDINTSDPDRRQTLTHARSHARTHARKDGQKNGRGAETHLFDLPVPRWTLPCGIPDGVSYALDSRNPKSSALFRKDTSRLRS